VAKRNASLFVTWKPELGWYAETGMTLVGDVMRTTRTPRYPAGYGRWDALAGYRTHDWDVRAALKQHHRQDLLQLGDQRGADPVWRSA
jgi:iron complex outermembrane receptor protein